MPLTVDQLTGYVERGLDADLARWFPDEEPVDLPASTRPVAPFLTRLPPAAATALAAFDRRVRSGTMPRFLDIEDWSYAFEFAENDEVILDSDYETELSDDDVWPMGCDGGGNYYVFLWSVVRYGAARRRARPRRRRGRLPGPRTAGSTGLGLLALMS